MSTSSAPASDPKELVRQDWLSATPAWKKWYSQLAFQSRQATELVVQGAALSPGMHVLDLASGSGEPALSVAAAGLEDAAHFAEGFLDVGNEHDAEAAGDAIKEAGGEWELLGVGGAEVDVFNATGGGVFLDDLEHFAEEVGGGYAALGADGGGDREGGFAGAAG